MSSSFYKICFLSFFPCCTALIATEDSCRFLFIIAHIYTVEFCSAVTDGAGVAIRGTVCRSTLSSFQILLEGKALSKATTSIKYSHRFEMQLCKAVRVVMFNEASPVVFACEQLRSPMIFIVQFPAVQMIYHFVCELNRNRQTKQTPGTHCVPDRALVLLQIKI